MTSHVEVIENGPIVELVFNRPEAKNALTLAMYEALVEGLEAAGRNPNVRAVILRGAQGNFTSGNDLKDFMQNPPTDESSPVFRFLLALIAFEKPVLAAVDGFAIGIGTTMLLHCDLVYCSERALFQLPFINLAVVPEAGSSLILPRMLGHQRAAELLYFGDRFDAATAREFGLVNAVVSEQALVDEVRSRAEILASKPPAALKETKRLLKRAHGEELQQIMSLEAQLFTQRLVSPEFAEAVNAFFEKRKPNFANSEA
jgi:enoyl-CoA hydratase/carnithine racemase